MIKRFSILICIFLLVLLCPIAQSKEKSEQIQLETLSDLYKDASKEVDKSGKIFRDEEMEIIGKTFWGRKPIHPRGKYGYVGRIPDVPLEFEYKKTKDVYKCLMPKDTNVEAKEMLPAPRDNKAYVDIVVKKGISSQYVNDVNDVILILQKLVANIQKDVNVQIFNAQVSALLDNIFYIQDRYHNKPEGNYISYFKMLEIANLARDVAIYRTEAQAYSKYLAYSGEGAIYRPERIQQEMDNLFVRIEETLVILKAVN